MVVAAASALALSMAPADQGLARAAGSPGPNRPNPRVIDPRNVETDTRSAYNLCHDGRERQFEDTPEPEARAIALTGRARRHGRMLTVGAARFIDTPPDAEASTRLYTYIGRFAAAPIDLVKVSYYEGDGWVLVDRVSGAHVELDGPPQLSPDGRTFAAENDSEQFDGDVQIVRFNGRGFGLIQKLDLGATCDLAWAGRDLLTLKHAQPDNAPWTSIRLRRSGGDWRIESVH